MTLEFINYIKELIDKKESVLLQEKISKLHPADIAEICLELDIEEARFLYRQLDNEKAADALYKRLSKTSGTRIPDLIDEPLEDAVAGLLERALKGKPF